MYSNQQSREELDARARRGETVIPGGTGGKSLEPQEHLAEGRSRGGQTRKEQLGTEGTKKWDARVGLAPRVSLVENVQRGRVSPSTNQSSRPGAKFICGGVSVTRDVATVIYCPEHLRDGGVSSRTSRAFV